MAICCRQPDHGADAAGPPDRTRRSQARDRWDKIRRNDIDLAGAEDCPPVLGL
jgi:hypothetical protein